MKFILEDNNGGGYNRRENMRGGYNSYNSRDKPTQFDRGFRQGGQFDNNSSSNGTADRRNFADQRIRPPPQSAAAPPKPTAENAASLHPSWQAKKQMEEKLKSLKFNGKKITFGDDD